MCSTKFTLTSFIIVLSFIVFALCYSQSDLFEGIKSSDYGNIVEDIPYQNNPILKIILGDFVIGAKIQINLY